MSLLELRRGKGTCKKAWEKRVRDLSPDDVDRSHPKEQGGKNGL